MLRIDDKLIREARITQVRHPESFAAAYENNFLGGIINSIDEIFITQ